MFELTIFVLLVALVYLVRSGISSVHIEFRGPSKATLDHINPPTGSSTKFEDTRGRHRSETDAPTGRRADVGTDQSLQDVTAGGEGQEAEYPLSALLRLATDMGVSDLAEQHDKYAHGTLREHDGQSG